MDKDAYDLVHLIRVAVDLYNGGSYREALSKFKVALVMSEKAGNDGMTVDVHTWIITSYDRCREVMRLT